MARHGFTIVGTAFVSIWSLSGLGVRWFARALAGRLSPPEQALVLAGHEWPASFETADSFPTIALVHGAHDDVGHVRRRVAAGGTPVLDVRLAHDADAYLEPPSRCSPAVTVHPEWEPEERAVARTLLALADLGVVAPATCEDES